MHPVAAELGPTATPTPAAVLAAFAYWIPEHEAETEEEAAEPVTVLVMGRRNIDVSDPPPDGGGGAGLVRRQKRTEKRSWGCWRFGEADACGRTRPID